VDHPSCETEFQQLAGVLKVDEIGFHRSADSIKAMKASSNTYARIIRVVKLSFNNLRG
jgi:hypothetical protein